MVAGVVRAIYRAGMWCADPGNHAEAAQIMAAERYLNTSPEIVLRALTGLLDVGGGIIREVQDYFIAHAGAANFPWKSHALWYYSQMVRWGEVAASPENAAIAAATYRPDLYRAALEPLGAIVPVADFKMDGARAVAGEISAVNGALVMGPDRFFDGEIYDYAELDAYIARQRDLPH